MRGAGNIYVFINIIIPSWTITISSIPSFHNYDVDFEGGGVVKEVNEICVADKF